MASAELPTSTPSTAAFLQAASRLAAKLAELPKTTRWLIDSDSDADGLCAAAVMSAALGKLGHRATVRPSREKDQAHYLRVCGEEADALMFLDKGSSHLADIGGASGTRPVVVLDHHNIVQAAPQRVVMLNPREHGLDGSRDASASTTAAALAYAMWGEHALKWGPTALSGAIGDWQHRPGWQGWNAELLQKCRQAGHVTDPFVPVLIGVNLAGAVSGRDYFPSYGEAAAWLTSLGLDPAAEVEDLSREEQTRLVSGLSMQDLALGRNRQKLVAPVEQHVRLGTSLRHVFRIADACGRLGHAATGIAFLLGDATAMAEAHKHFAAYKEQIAHALEGLQTDGTTRMQACQWAWTTEPALTGMVAGIGMMHSARERDLPLVVLARRPDEQIQISTRGIEAMVDAGLDLGDAVRTAAATVQRDGGGHPVAAGTVVAADQVDSFLASLDAALQQQGFLA